MEKKSNMYDEAKTWKPFKGCRFRLHLLCAEFPATGETAEAKVRQML